MAVAPPRFGNEGLSPDAYKVLIAAPIASLSYPPICPNCGATATRPVTLTKSFQFSPGGDSGWGYRVTQATPSFCDACIDRHLREAVRVTDVDRARSLASQPLLIPAFGLAVFGGLIFLNSSIAFVRSPEREWPIMLVALVMILVARTCASSAWDDGRPWRVPLPTQVSAAFDFGDDDESAFHKTARTYAIRNADCAREFHRLNSRGARPGQ